MATRRTRNTKVQILFRGGERETMKTRDQRRKRRLLGCVFVGQAPQKRSLAGPASCLLLTLAARLAKKGCRMGSKYACQIWHKIWQKSAKKCTKLAVNHQDGINFGQGLIF